MQHLKAPVSCPNSCPKNLKELDTRRINKKNNFLLVNHESIAALNKKQEMLISQHFLFWCRWWDLNPHAIAGNGF